MNKNGTLNSDVIKFSLWNVRSLKNKVRNVMATIVDCDSDIVFLTETWLTTVKSKSTAEIKEYNYDLLHNPRSDSRRGGGVGVMTKNTIKCRNIKSSLYSSFEHVIVKVSRKLVTESANEKSILLICIYRLQDISVSVFFDEFSDLLSVHSVLSKDIILAGDFNIHVDVDDITTITFLNILKTFSLKQLIAEPTHLHGHTLDLVICRVDENDITNTSVKNYDLSDHYLVNFSLASTLNMVYSKKISFHKLKD